MRALGFRVLGFRVEGFKGLGLKGRFRGSASQFGRSGSSEVVYSMVEPCKTVCVGVVKFYTSYPIVGTTLFLHFPLIQESGQ